MRLTLDTPPGFSFERTVRSHGWWSLRPFEPEGRDGLRAVLALPRGGACPILLRAGNGAVVLETPGSPGSGRRRQIEQAARRILNLDLDLTPFYRLVRRERGTRWIAETGSGRLLRSGSLFEDLVKLVLTTNCSWALTTRMVDGLVEHYGDRAPDGSRCFPRAERLAHVPERSLREKVKTGYRAPQLARLVREVAAGRTDPEGWERDDRNPEELRGEMLALPGVGPYVAENMLRLLGRPRGLALDSWLRAKYARVYHGGRRVTDRTIARRYARFGDWGGLAFWCEMTRDWFSGDGPSRLGVELK